MAARECTILRDTIAQTCRMEGMNINVSRHQGMQPEGFTVGANLNFHVTLK
jgi:hypothetical protein